MSNISSWRIRWYMLCASGPLKVGLAFGLPLICVCTMYFWSFTEAVVRFHGLLLQLFGMLLLLYGLSKTLEELGEEPILASIWNWLRRFISGKPRYVHGTGHAATKISASMKATPQIAEPKNDSLEERIKRLEAGLNAVKWQLELHQDQSLKEIDRIRSDLKSEREERRKIFDGLNRKVHSLHAGGARLSAVGTVWLFAGVVLGTIPNEISCLFVKQSLDLCLG